MAVAQRFVIEQQELGPVTLLQLEGPLRLNLNEANSRRTLCDEIRSLMSEGAHRIVLDLTKLDSPPDSSGVGDLVATQLSLRKAGGELVLVNVPAKLRYLIEIMRLDSLFRIAETPDEAVALLKNEEQTRTV